jgi:PAS domain S-box-containing protein
LNIAFPYRDSNSNIAGVIVVGIDLNEYADVLRLAQITDGSNLVLIDYSGTTLFSVMDRESMVGKPYDSGVFRRMHSGADIDTLIFNIDDESKTRYLSYRKLYLNGEREPYMYVLVTVPARPIITQVNKQIVVKMNQLLLVLISALFLSWFVAEKAIADRIRLLKDASRKLAEGDDQIRVSHVIKGGELGTLGEAFDHMAQQLLLRKKALLQREADLKKAQELAKLGSWNLDSSGTLTWSFEMFRIFGVSPDSYIPTAQNFLELVHPDDRPAMKAWIQACEAGECNGELQFRRILPDGTIKHISGCGELTYNSEGKWTRMSGTAQDITDRKRAENTIIEKQYELEELNKGLEARISDAVTELRKKDNILMLQSRQAAMGETIGNIAHQWRQPLNALGLIVQELKLTYGHEDFTRESLDANVDKAMQLILHLSLIHI